MHQSPSRPLSSANVRIQNADAMNSVEGNIKQVAIFSLSRPPPHLSSPSYLKQPANSGRVDVGACGRFCLLSSRADTNQKLCRGLNCARGGKRCVCNKSRLSELLRHGIGSLWAICGGYTSSIPVSDLSGRHHQNAWTTSAETTGRHRQNPHAVPDQCYLPGFSPT